MMVGKVEMTEIESHRQRSQADFAAKLPSHLERLRWDAGQVAAYQQARLRELIAHARQRSPFHAARLADVDPRTFRLEDLASLPTMTKSDVMDAFDQVVTDRRLNRSLVERRVAATGDQPNLLLDEYICLASGGSSGQRGVFVWHWSALSDYFLAVVRGAMAGIMAAGGPPPGGVPAALVAAGSAIHATRACAEMFSGPFVRLEVLPATLPLDTLVAKLNAVQPALLLGYAQVLGRLAAEQRAGRLRIAPTSVTGTSEMFWPELKAQVGAAFDAPVVDSFGSTEGLIGAAAPGDDAFSLASDVAIAELVDEEDRPVAPGAPSAKVLITSLINLTQPLIRYELRDRMVERPPSPHHGHQRVAIDGRADESFRFGTLVVHPFALRSVLVRAAEVIEYQVRQTAGGVHALVVASHDADLDGLRRSLGAALGDAGVRDPSVTLEVVDAIPRDQRTGKVARFVPLS